MKDDGQDIRLIVEDLLPDWLILDIEQTSSDGYSVVAQYALPVKFCPVCGTINPRLMRYGKKEIIKRLPIEWICIRTIRQRYKCKECDHTFWEPLPPLEGPANTKQEWDFESIF